VSTVTFDRPELLNSLTFDIYGDLRDLTAELKSRSDIRALVIRGEGRGFCSGGDVNDIIAKLLDMNTRQVYDFAHMTGEVVRNIRSMPQPVIAGVNGIAAGAGAVIAAAADIRIVARSAAFHFLFTKVGLSGGDMGVCWLLPRLIGFGRATHLLMTGERLDSESALQWGLATQVVDDSGLDAAVDDYISRLKSVGPWGIQMTKEMLNRGASMDFSTAIEMEAWTQTMLMTADDFREFRDSFAEKRLPQFQGH
jgi:enoyl-CoA hydratase/carnithine racemase